jgi:tetratricopeptide (TPR) repeat protein
MKFNKLLSKNLIPLFFAFILFAAFLVQAQEPISDSRFAKALETYHTANYVAAEKSLNELRVTVPANDPLRYDIDYYRLMCLVKQNNRFAESAIVEYLSENGESPWENQLWFELAKLQFNSRRYKVAAKTFENVDQFVLSKADADDYRFYCGYSNFDAGDYKKASQYFFDIKKTNSIYAQPSSYYWGYINYLEGKYETALQEFRKLENNKEFAGFIPYYTIQIYYVQEKYDLVIEIGEKIIYGAPEEQKNELMKILGDAYFETGKYISAIKFLDGYKGVGGKKTREDFYRLGYCYYMTKNYLKAIEAFENVTNEKDELAQNTLYHMAECNLKINNKKNARTAFEQASKMSFNPTIEEDALFNFAKLSYELSYSPFNETIKAFDQYITKYPNSERNDAAFDYLVKVYMTTRNYRDATSSIEKIKVKSPSVREAYQRVTYFRGLEMFNDGNYRGAIDFFSKSLENATFNQTYKAQAQYWKAESNYRLGQFQTAIEGFTTFQSLPGAFSLPEFSNAYYNIGYCYFGMKKFHDASVWFRKYLNQSRTTPTMNADANNRTGDYYFLNREYQEAIKHYTASFSTKAFDPDYALYQRALCRGLDKDLNGKYNDLKALEVQFPSSSYVDDALFEMARTQERLNLEDDAITTYNRLISSHNESTFTKKALLQLGLIYYNKSDNERSLNYYKQVVNTYPNTEESNSALIGIKNNYIDLNNVDAYFEYSGSAGNKVQVSSSSQDSIFYMATERKYMAGDKDADVQLEEYLRRFPDGSFKLSATFYLAETCYGKGQYTRSLELYEKIAAEPDNIFTEQSLLKAGELSFNAQKYDLSLNYFTRLAKIASTKWNIVKSKAGIMRSYFKINDYQNAITAAKTVIQTENSTDIIVREANYIQATSHYKLSQPDEALKFYSLLSADTKLAEGAESKYFKARILFEKKMLNEAEVEILDFINKNTPHQFWLAQSFILLSDIYLAKEDIFQARHTLQSLIDNYSNQTDGILTTAKEKMQVVESLGNQNLIQN